MGVGSSGAGEIDAVPAHALVDDDSLAWDVDDPDDLPTDWEEWND